MSATQQPRTTADWYAVLAERDEAVATIGRMEAQLLASGKKVLELTAELAMTTHNWQSAESELKWTRDGYKAQLAAAEADAAQLAERIGCGCGPDECGCCREALAVHEARIRGDAPKMPDAIEEALKRPYLIAPDMIQNQTMVPMADVLPLLSAIDDITPYCKPKYGMPDGDCEALEDAPIEFRKKHPPVITPEEKKRFLAAGYEEYGFGMGIVIAEPSVEPDKNLPPNC